MKLSPDEARWLLAHINDNAALSAAELVRELPAFADGEPLARADRLRAAILDSVEFLRPPRGSSIRSPEARTHAVLWLRYVEGMTVEEVSEEMALSERQLHRELRSAEAKLANVLSELLAGPSNSATPAGEAGELSVAVQPAPIRLEVAVAGAVSTVEPLARALHRRLSVGCDLSDDRLFADEGVLHQVLTQVLSLVLQNTLSPDVEVRVLGAGSGMARVVVGPADRAGVVALEALDALQRLAASVNLTVSTDVDAQPLAIVLDVPLRQPKTVLVVEDSTAAIELYRRCLEPSGVWRIVDVCEPKLAYDVARRLQPSVILLDLLMPGTDGWTVLNMLRAREDTSGIPVIVCSVFQDPLLAEALGAAAHLRKPISQNDLIAALERHAR